MNILVVGCGDVGVSLIQRLEALGHQISVVEESEEALAKLTTASPPFCGMAIRGVPIDQDVLRSAGIEDCDAVAAVAHDDNINIMVAQIAHTVFNIKNVFARIIDPATRKVYASGFGFQTICDTNLATEALIIGLLPEKSLEEKTITLGTTTIFLSYTQAQTADIGKKLSEITPPRHTQMTFGVKRRSGIVQLATQADMRIEAGDSIIFAGTPE